jgi:putative toxin-antitoxin system antitoxin component (TIGR02293 family)
MAGDNIVTYGHLASPTPLIPDWEQLDYHMGMAQPKRTAARRAAQGTTFSRLVTRPPDPAQAIETVRQGLPARAIDEAVAYMEVAQKDLLAALRIPMSTYHRRLAANETLSSSESEKVLRLGDIARRAEETFGSSKAAREWLTTKNLALGGPPLALIDTEAGAGQVRRVLASLDFGGVA